MIRSENDPINQGYLQNIALKLGAEWRQLANFLNISHVRIQAICQRNSHHADAEEKIKYDVLVTWAKTVPISIRKVTIFDDPHNNDYFYLIFPKM